jgi:hypothetical protein
MCAPMPDAREPGLPAPGRLDLLPARGPSAKTGATEKNCALMLPADDCDLLYGVAMIARWLGLSLGQAKPLIDDGTIPTFKPPGHTNRCALKSIINDTARRYAEKTR